jgi:nucleoside-diphosphate-sugar epimerase
MGKLIALTGATGFAGRHAVIALMGRGYRIRALARRPAAAALPAEVELVAGDLDDQGALDRLVAGADAAVHVAGAITALTAHDYFRVNAHGTVAMAEAARRAGVARFVHLSSLSAREPKLSSYGASKRAGEDAIAALMAPLNAIVLRPPAVYGPGDKATLPLLRELTRPIAAIPGRRDARFSLIHVSDLAQIIVDAIETGQQGIHEISDQTSGGYGWPDLLEVASAARGTPIRAIFLPRAIPEAVAYAAEMVARLRGQAGMINRGKIAELYHSDWVTGTGGLSLPRPITFARGFPETLAWYREAGWLPRVAPADRNSPESRGQTPT